MRYFRSETSSLDAFAGFPHTGGPQLKQSVEYSWQSKDKVERLLNFLAEARVKRAGKAMRRSLSDVAPVLTVQDLAHYLKVHPSTVYRLTKAGKLPAFKVGSAWRFNVEEIDRWRLEGEKKPDV